MVMNEEDELLYSQEALDHPIMLGDTDLNPPVEEVQMSLNSMMGAGGLTTMYWGK